MIFVVVDIRSCNDLRVATFLDIEQANPKKINLKLGSGFGFWAKFRRFLI